VSDLSQENIESPIIRNRSESRFRLFPMNTKFLKKMGLYSHSPSIFKQRMVNNILYSKENKSQQFSLSPHKIKPASKQKLSNVILGLIKRKKAVESNGMRVMKILG